MAMTALLSHDDPAVQPDVLACLGEAGSRAHVVLPVLEKLLDDPEPSTRASAVRAILRIEDKKAPASPRSCSKWSPTSHWPQEWRMEILGRIKETAPATLARATPGLIRQLGDSSANVRREALELLSIHHRGHPRRDAEQGRCQMTDGTPLGKPGTRG